MTKTYICKYCGKPFTEKYSKWSNGDFCSKSCSRKFSHTFINKEKLSEKMKKISQLNPLSKEEIEKRVKTFNNTIKERLMNTNWSSLSEEQVKKRLFFEQEGKCNKCGNSEWLGQQISLELEHKDGNHNNNSRDNVELLCPNCHSQTDTYRGRNVNNAGKRYTNENMVEAFIKEGTIYKALKSLGMAAKGKNYERFARCLLKYGFNVKKEKGRYVILGH